ncbi:MAG: regulatory protein RecX [Gordonia sp. (in: high G+C Gram-positive bacteria)]|uniref:regulatory protein RecX n=1 Tax=Gordonia sp. (in: high G+C Gram-positive bacteria) TaxID=84139 RepID=UPI0039E50139
MTEGPSAWDAALRLLGVRARSRSEMAERLLRRGFETDEVADVLVRLDAAGLLDDAEFAHEWVQSRSRHSGRGRVALRRELRTKGVADHTVDEALSGIDPADERAQALELAAKKLRTANLDLNDHADRTKAYRRLAGVLGRRGYPADVISGVVAEVIGDARRT